MNYYSLNKKSPNVTFREAAITGLAPDKGLYFPETIPTLSDNLLKNLKNMSKAEIAFEVIKPFIGDEIDEKSLFEICEETVDFDFPLVKINDKISSLELFHGPTLAFKDVGARFMSRCLGYFSKGSKEKITVLVATSGDTGSAVANGFLGVEGVEVVLLYPKGKVSKIQELQLTTLGQNITALEVEGTFDDCQAIVKKAFLDEELNDKYSLTSANSINVARWLPQQFYYFYALQQWQEEQAPVISVPSGNFGNICAGLIASVGGAPIKHFVAACNTNDIFSHYTATKEVTPKTAVPTISNAMDVGNPSNFIRMLELFDNDHKKITDFISDALVSEKTTADTMVEVYSKDNYLLEPHGAVAYYGLNEYLKENSEDKGLILETAHPVKFGDTVKNILNKEVEIPESMKYLLNLEKKSSVISPTFDSFKELMLAR